MSSCVCTDACVCDSICMCAHEHVHVEVSEQPWVSCLGMSSSFSEFGSLNSLKLINYAGGTLPASSRGSPVSASSVLDHPHQTFLNMDSKY